MSLALSLPYIPLPSFINFVTLLSLPETPDTSKRAKHNDVPGGFTYVDKDGEPGRRKIRIEYITDKSRRHITFSKRKAGIMKKVGDVSCHLTCHVWLVCLLSVQCSLQAYELSILTGTQVLLLVVSETGLVYTFTTTKLQPLVQKAEGKNLIQVRVLFDRSSRTNLISGLSQCARRLRSGWSAPDRYRCRYQSQERWSRHPPAQAHCRRISSHGCISAGSSWTISFRPRDERPTSHGGRCRRARDTRWCSPQETSTLWPGQESCRSSSGQWRTSS